VSLDERLGEPAQPRLLGHEHRDPGDNFKPSAGATG
jgi:hypothetical protein